MIEFLFDVALCDIFYNFFSPQCVSKPFLVNEGRNHPPVRGASGGLPGALEARHPLHALLPAHPRQHPLRLVLQRQLLLNQVGLIGFSIILKCLAKSSL